MDCRPHDSAAPRAIEEALAEVESALEAIEANTDCESEEVAALLIAVAVALLAKDYRPAEIQSWVTQLVAKITSDLAATQGKLQ